MAKFRKLDPLHFDGNVTESWRIFELDFDIFLSTGHSTKTKEQAYILLNIAGCKAIEKRRSFTYKPAVTNVEGAVITPAEDKEHPNILKTKFHELCSSQKKIIMERHKLTTRNQKSEGKYQSTAKAA